MQKLAPWAVWAVEVLVEPLALLGLVVLVHVCPLLELVVSVGERACVTVLALAIELPKFTDLCFEFQPETLCWLAVSVPLCLGCGAGSFRWLATLLGGLGLCFLNWFVVAVVYHTSGWLLGILG